MAQFAAQVGAAALALGLSLAGPGLAAADSGDSSTAGSDSVNQSSRSGTPAGNRRGVTPAVSARKASANKSAVAPAAAPRPVAAIPAPPVVPVDLNAAPWLRVGGAKPSSAAPVAVASDVTAVPPAAQPVSVQPSTVASIRTPSAAAAGTSALSRLMSGLLPAQGLVEGSLLMVRRRPGGVGPVKAAAPRPAAAVDANGNQVVTLNDPNLVTQGSISIRGVLFGLFGGTLNTLDDLNSGGYTHNYVAVNFTATESKTYVFGQTGAPEDTVIVVYNQGQFDPANPRNGAIYINDNSTAGTRPAGIVMDPAGCGGNSSDCPQVSIALAAGQTITLMISTAGASTGANPRPLGLPQNIYTNGGGSFWQPGNNFPFGNLTVSEPDANGQDFGVTHITDPDGDPLTYTASTPTKGSVTVNPNGTFVYTPSAAGRHIAATDGASGADLGDSFTITASDGRGGFVTIPVILTVAPANSAPTAAPTAGTPNQTTGVVAGSVNVTDADADVITYIASTPGKGSVTVAADGTFTYTPTDAARHAAAADGASGAVLADAFNVTINDGHGGTAVVPVSVVVGAGNAVPAGNVTVGSPGATGQVSGTTTVTDADADPLNYTVSTPAQGSVTLGPNGAFTYTPTDAARHAAAAGGVTTDAFTITVTDGHGGTLNIPVAVAISPTNVVPTGSVSVGAADAAGRVSGTVNVNDGDADAVTYTASAPGLGSVVLGAGGGFTYTPTDAARHAVAAGGATTDAFTITVNDGHGGTVTVPVSVMITSANAAPTGSVNVRAADAAGLVTGAVSATDGDSDVLSYNASAPALGSVTVGPDGSFTYTPTDVARHAAAAVGGVTADAFTITVSDGHGGTLDMPVTVAIAPVNAAPAASVTVRTPDAGGRVTGAVQATDADSDVLTYTASAPANGTVTVNADGTFKYVPSGLQHSGDTFSITVSDGHGGTVVVPVTVAGPAIPAEPASSGGGGGQAGAGYSGSTTAPMGAVSAAAAPAAAPAEPMGVAAAVSAAVADVAAAEAAPAAAANQTEASAAPQAEPASPATAAAEPAAASAPEAAGAAAAGAAGTDGRDAKDRSNARSRNSGTNGAAPSRPGGQQGVAMAAGRAAGKTAGKSAGNPTPPSAEEEASKSDPRSPSNPAAALGLIGVLLMTLPMAGASASAAAGTKAVTG